MDRANTPINSLLEQAACIIGRCKEAAGETEPTEGYKGRQTEELIKFANDNGLWIDIRSMRKKAHSSLRFLLILGIAAPFCRSRRCDGIGGFLCMVSVSFSGVFCPIRFVVFR